MKKTFLVFGLFGLWLLPSMAMGMGFEVAVGGWYQAPQGDVAYKTNITPTTLDLEDDLIFDSEFQLNARAKVELPLPFVPSFYAIASPMEFEGTGNRVSGFQFGDVNFSAGDDFTTTLTLNNYDFAIYWGIPFLNPATINTLNIDLGLNIRVMDFTIEAVQPPTVANSNQLEESKSYTLPVPMAYAAVQLGPIADFSLEAEARAAKYKDNLIYSLTARLKRDILGFAFAAAGYRYDRIKIDEKGVEADTSFSGPFVEAGLQF